MPTSKSDLASRASMVTGLSCSAAASTSALSRRSSPIAASYSRTAACWAGVSPGSAFHLAAWFWNNKIAGLVLVHPDDPGHNGVIEPVGLGQSRLQQGELLGGDLDALTDVLGEPADLAEGYQFCSRSPLTPPSVEPAGLARGGTCSPIRPRSYP
jgi:hypothetical protein